ncbi:MAG: DUF416 family protein [Bacteroidota bacterium]
MEIYENYEGQLIQNITLLSVEKKINFAIEICERLLPEYEKFEIESSWGNSKSLKHGIDYCKRNRNLKNLNIILIRKLIESIDQVTPHMDDYGHLQGSFAMNAGLAIIATLQFIWIEKIFISVM